MAFQPGEKITAKVVGVTFNGRQAVVSQLSVGEPLRLRREPSNAYDANAIRVERLSGAQVGYVARDLAQAVAPFLDRAGGTAEAAVAEVVGGHGPGYSLGVRIRFVIPMDPHTRPRTSAGISIPGKGDPLSML